MSERALSLVSAPWDYEAIIVGTGFGGMGAAIQFTRLGIDSILMLDRASDLGGTWNHNRYPGVAVDIASVTYSYSFEPNPFWSRLYAPGSELRAYASHVADKYDLRRFMRFRSKVEKVVYDEARERWTVFIEGQPSLTCRFLVLGTGYFAQPKRPEIDGLESFSGKVIHTAEWDDSYDLTGKRVAIIGTGATAVQVIPEIAPKTEQLDVYQRTAIWVAPKPDAKISPTLQAWFKRIPLTQKLARFANSALLEFMGLGLLHYKQLPFILDGLQDLCRKQIKKQVRDPALRKKLTPDYGFFCKRPTFSNTFYPTFNRPNVSLVTEPIDRIEADGIVTKDGKKRPIDTLILATGFKMWERGGFPSVEVIGKNGANLGDLWHQGGYQSYEGLSIPGFPNLFNLHAPYSFTGVSFFYTIEVHMKRIERVIREMRKRNAASIEVKPEARDKFVAGMKRVAKGTVIVSGNCSTSHTYYLDSHGEVTLARLEPTALAFWRAGHFSLDDYRYS